ncbi:hypothetical protein CH252_04990 [Rhodococcus sp. 06-1477-1B]|nr:hypothetical protein CH252_04990 [Rhodococcus sp. 06-1477-1B]
MLRVAGRAPQTIEAWWSALESYLTEMDWAYLRVQATQLHRRIPKDVRDRTGLTRDDCYGFVLLKVVDDTFTGLGREDAALPVLQRLYPDVAWAFAGNNLDAGSAFDLVGFTGSRLTHVASVKPASWRHFYTKSKMWENRHKEHQKHERFLTNRPDVLGIEISGEVEKDDWQVVPVLGRPCKKCELS